MNWIQFTSLNQLSEIFESSKKQAVLIFKYSTRCGISRFALRDFERNLDIPSEKLKLYFLDLIKYREISNEVAIQLKVHHQSPQVIVVKNKKVVYHDSHNSISVTTIKKAIL